MSGQRASSFRGHVEVLVCEVVYRWVMRPRPRPEAERVEDCSRLRIPDSSMERHRQSLVLVVGVASELGDNLPPGPVLLLLSSVQMLRPPRLHLDASRQMLAPGPWQALQPHPRSPRLGMSTPSKPEPGCSHYTAAPCRTESCGAGIARTTAPVDVFDVWAEDCLSKKLLKTWMMF